MIRPGRYHTNEDGKTLPCTAGERPCRFIHGDTPSESSSKWHETMDSQLIPSPVKYSANNAEKRRQFRETSLKNMSDSELSEALLLEAEELDFDMAKISEAIALASDLHGKQYRKGNRGDVSTPPYIEHPLRNSLRLVRLGTIKQEIIAASILHDTVEDGSFVFAKRQGLSNRIAADEHQSREMLTAHIEERFNGETRRIVIGVTNEIPPADHKNFTTEQKHQIYYNHCKNEVVNDPAIFLVKLSDFIDNATGLYHNVATMDPEKVRSQARKYRMVTDMFEHAARTLDLPIPQHSRELIIISIVETRRRLDRIIAGWNGVGKI